MKSRNRLLVTLVAVFLVAAPGFAPCWYPEQTWVEYWQIHGDCANNGGPLPGPCNEYWTLDGECYTDCDGTTSCSGDTEVRERTIVEYRTERCPNMVCDQP